MVRSRYALSLFGALYAAAFSAASSGCYVPPPEEASVAAPVKEEKKLQVTGAGAALERVTSEPVSERRPQISPRGDILLFYVVVYESSSSDTIKQQVLNGVDPNTRANRTVFTSTNSFSNHPAWLPDQSSYVYASNAPGDWSLVKALSASPNAAVSVVASPDLAPAASFPCASPDGQRIAFSASIRGSRTLATIGVDGSRMTLLGEGDQPSWSPDGAALVFTREVNGYDQLFLVNAANGTDLVQLTSGEYHHRFPAWSPDGRFIAFTTNRGWNKYRDGSEKSIFNLYVLNRDGTGLTQLTEGDTIATEPHWGRDNWIYFASNQADNFDVWRLQPAGDYGNLRSVAPGAPPAPGAAPPPPSGPPAAAGAGGPSRPTAPPASGSGCTKDTDCKGDRICQQGSCVAP